MTTDTSRVTTGLHYLHGFGNEHESEALPGALPVGRFEPAPRPVEYRDHHGLLHWIDREGRRHEIRTAEEVLLTCWPPAPEER